MAIEKCNYVFKGTVITGNHIGRGMGIPTVNIPVKDDVGIPKFGVYAAIVRIVEDKEDTSKTDCIRGIANIGVKPTIAITNEAGEVVPNPIGIEVNLFDFSDDLYGKELEVQFVGFLRGEKKFDSIEELKSQINSDILDTENYFNNGYAE